MGADLLLCIDLQQVFAADSGTPWATGGFPEAVEGTRAVLDAFGDRVVFTRFIPPAHPRAAWRDYYQRWEFATDATAAFWSLVEPWQDRPTLDFPTLSKWDSRVAGIVGDHDLVLSGVTTDCCVMATALGAADAGVRVRIIADACGAASPRLHELAVELLTARMPLITISTVDQELARNT